MEDRDPDPLIFHPRFYPAHGPLAQLVEQLTLNQRVRSSSLRRPTIFFRSRLFSALGAEPVKISGGLICPAWIGV